MLKRIATSILHKFGYEIFHHSKLQPADMAAHVRAILNHFKVDCVLDVGANEGQFADFLRQLVGYRGLLVSFEPSAETFALLAGKAGQDANWITHNCAVGEENSRKQFNIMKSSEMNSFLEPDSSDSGLFDLHNTVTRRETVQMRTVDSVVAELRRTHAAERIYLKIDTQGYDMQVIDGAGTVLPDVVAIQTEAAFQRLYAGMPGHLETLQKLDRLGWDLSGVFPIQVDSTFRLIEADCVFVNRNEARKEDTQLLLVPGLTHM